jgi:pyrophosphatase PpaX
VSANFTPGAIIFDFDGTMVNSEEETIRIARPVISKHLGREISDREMDGLKGKVWKKEFRNWFPENHMQVHQEIIQSWEQTDPEINAYTGVSEILRIILENGIPMGIASSRETSLLEEIIEKLEWKRYFKAVVGQDDTVKHKPEPEPLLLAAEKMGLKPSECIYIGDQIWDIKASKAAGMISGAALWGEGNIDALAHEKPDFMFHNPDDVPAQLLVYI